MSNSNIQIFFNVLPHLKPLKNLRFQGKDALTPTKVVWNKMASDVNIALSILKDISEDTSVPRNIRRSASEALDVLNNVDAEPSPAIRANIATSILEETSLDPNCPVHARTKIWTAISKLEIIEDDEDDEDDEEE